MGHFLHPQAAPQHEHEDRPVSPLWDQGKESGHFFIFQIPRQRPGQAQGGSFLNRVGTWRSFLLAQVGKKSPDAVQTAVNRLGGQSLAQQEFDIGRDLRRSHFYPWPR